MIEQSVEDVLAMSQLALDQEQDWHGWSERDVAELVDEIASADLPLVDRERGIAVIRLDPELAAVLVEESKVADGWCDHEHGEAFGASCCSVRQFADVLRRAARIIGGEQP